MTTARTIAVGILCWIAACTDPEDTTHEHGAITTDPKAGAAAAAPKPPSASEHGHQDTEDAGLTQSPALGSQTQALPAERDGLRLYAVRFDLRAGDKPFGCGKPAELGLTHTLVEPNDARMYVHDVALVRANGERVPLELYQESEYQRDNVALIDFADDTGQCFTGHPEVNKAVYGYAPENADYTGVAFKVGIPESANHLDGAVAPAPFNASGMWWSWSGGYKYLRLDLTSKVQPIWYFHGGAAGCSGTSVSGFTCAARQIAEVQVLGFDTNSSVVVFDAKKFYEHADLSQADALPGCMGGKDDADCKPLYAALGVNVWDDAAPRPEQTVFSVVAGSPWQPPTTSAQRSLTDPGAWPNPDFQRPDALDRTNISKADEARSHALGDPRHGASCMRCHQSQGPGIGRFTAAGSLFSEDGQPAHDVRVEIIGGTPDRANNTIKDVTTYAVLDVDKNGNFFTTEPIPYDEQKLTARVLDATGKPILTMFSTKQTGACNTCHTASFRLTLPNVAE